MATASEADDTNPANTALTYLEVLTPDNEYDFSFALENPRFSDYTLVVIPVTPAAAPEDDPQPEPENDNDSKEFIKLDILYANGLWSETSVLGKDVINLLGEELESKLSTADEKILIADEKILIPISSLIVGVRSLYFRKILDSGNFEVSRKIPLKVHRQEVETLRLLLKFMYLYNASPLKTMDLQELLRFLLLADKLQAPTAVRSTVAELKCRPVSLDSCARFLDLPEHLEPIIYPLLDLCADFLEDKFGHLDEVLHDQELRTDFCSLTRRAFSFLLRSDKVTVQTEDTVFMLLQYWAKSQGLSPQAFHEEPYVELLEHLRYAYMSTEFLNSEVIPSPVMSTPYAHKLVNEGVVFRSAPESFREKLLDEAMHIRFVERPKPPPEVLGQVDPSLSPRKSAGIGGFMGRLGSYMLGMEPKPSV